MTVHSKLVGQNAPRKTRKDKASKKTLNPPVKHWDADDCKLTELIPANEDLWQILIEDPEILTEIKRLWDEHGHSRDLTFLDVFAGWAGLARSFKAIGFSAKAFDRHMNMSHDFCTRIGYAHLIFFALRVIPEFLQTLHLYSSFHFHVVRQVVCSGAGGGVDVGVGQTAVAFGCRTSLLGEGWEGVGTLAGDDGTWAWWWCLRDSNLISQVT